MVEPHGSGGFHRFDRGFKHGPRARVSPPPPLYNLKLKYHTQGLYTPEGSSEPRMVEVVGMSTTVDVIWEDGTTTTRVPARNLVLHDPGPHSFFPNELVRRKSTGGAVDHHERPLGVVATADAQSRMVRAQGLWRVG